MTFLIPILVGCALAAYVVLRAFDTTSNADAGAHGEAASSQRSGVRRPAPVAATSRAPIATDAVGVSAPPPPSSAVERATAEGVRLDLERRLRDSGPAPMTWTGEMSGAVGQVLRAPELQAALRNAPEVECFAEGCMASLVFASAADFELHQERIGEATALDPWPHVVTGAERQPDGSVRNAVVVFRPHDRDELAAIEARRAELRAAGR